MTTTECPIAFPSCGATLRGVLVFPTAKKGPLPAVVLAHGFTATVQMVAIEYARAFARSGIAALVYDHRNFGCSDGQPRSEVNPWIQCRGYRDALDFICARTDIDPRRVALWGDSFTGAQVFLVAACDPRPTAVVAQCPTFGATLPEALPSDELHERIRATLYSGNVCGTPETTTGPRPVVSHDQAGTPSFLLPIQAFRWFIDYGGRPGSGWVNSATRVLSSTPVPYAPILCVPYVKAATLIMASPEDEIVSANYQVARRAYEWLPGKKRWYDIADGHFGLLYHPGRRFDEAVEVQSAFLRAELDA
jgi:dienelactone hydrolase